ncbi:MAG TPA: molybdopterin-guanine dinucleotide biosynthesis protein B [Candidatus Jeotgalicoccus stercoravium]|jgi:molybdopterin-guanine dinucleotide biosynthesis protein B|nr:molybdopterin-guanine dinucleotide biosynthesis protein B [Candidatus Jeotgalicoccus stercoravium]
MQILQVVGFKDSGKTTLTLEFLKILKDHGKTVAVIKNHHLDEAVKEDTDTGKYHAVGSDYTVLNMPSYTMTYNQASRDLSHLIEKFKTEDVDFVLAEGFKAEDYPKILLTYSFKSGETDIGEIGLKHVLKTFDLRYDKDSALTWFKEWSQCQNENV